MARKPERNARTIAFEDAYLTAGSILLQRRAMRSAERYRNKAFDLDPLNK